MADDLLDTVEKALAFHEGGGNPVEACPLCFPSGKSDGQMVDWLRSLLSRCREADKELAALRERHAEDVEHAFAAGVTFTATCTDQMSAGLRKWPEYKAKWARREP